MKKHPSHAALKGSLLLPLAIMLLPLLIAAQTQGETTFSLQLSVANLFDARDLIATGNNARYTDGRRLSMKASVQF
ncbi:MAG: hypothetical protein GWO81_01750 [Verrucomicrobia bacterium]|nr:hypothetical protein [Verrucomicrobiota bacterium]